MPLTAVKTSNLDTTNSLFFRNRIINGDMRIDQRNAGASVALASSAYASDRFAWHDSNEGGKAVGTLQQVSDAPPNFSYSLRLTTTTAKTSTGAANRAQFRPYPEGYTVADFNWGTANARSVTLSFWVKASATGTYPVALINQTEDRSYVTTYTVNAISTWEYKTITVPGDTSGTWDKTSGIGIRLTFDMGSGSNYVAPTANTWATGWYFSLAGVNKPVSVLNSTWQITGVQLEIGTAATAFETRPYGTELALCQRYYENSFSGAKPVDGTAQNFNGGALGATAYSTNALRSIMFIYAVPKRATPSITLYAPGVPAGYTANTFAYYNNAGSGWTSMTTSSIETSGTFGFNIRSGASSISQNAYMIDGGWAANAEIA